MPELAIQDGVELALKASGTPDDLALELNLRTLKAPTRVALTATTKSLLSTLMQSLKLPPGAPAPSLKTPSYEARLAFDHVDPSALMASLPSTDVSGALAIDGSGIKPGDTLKAQTSLKIEPSTLLDQWTIERGEVVASIDGERLEITRGGILTPYADATITGEASWPGQFDFALTAEALDRHKRQVEVPELGTLSQQRFELVASVSGALDLGAEDVVQSLERARLETRWDIAGLGVPQALTLDSSQGSLEAALSSPGPTDERLVTLDLSAEAAGLDVPDTASVSSLKATANARVETPWPLDDPAALRHALLATIDLRLGGARAAGASVGLLDARLALSPSSGQLAYDLNVRELKGLSYPQSDLALGQAEADLKGAVELSSTFEPRYLAARGEGRIERLRAAEQRVGAATFKLDLAGTPPLLRGDIELDARDLEVSQFDLSRALLDAELAADGHFALDARLTTAPGEEDERPERLKLTAGGHVNDALTEVSGIRAEIYNLNVDEGDPIWRVTDASVVSKGGTLEVRNLSLENGEQAIAIDGVYRERGAQDLSVSARHINIGQLRRELLLESVLPEMRGEVERIDLKLTGTAKAPEIALDVIVREFYYENLGPFVLVLEGRYEDELLTVNTLDLDGYGEDMIRGQARVPIALDLSGNMDINWRQNILVTLFVDPIDVGRIAGQIKQLDAYDIDGVISGGGVINGTLREPMVDFNLNANGASFTGTVNDQRIEFDDLSLTTRVEYEPPAGQDKGLKIASEFKRGARSIASLDVSSPLPVAEWLYETIELGREVDYAVVASKEPFKIEAKLDALRLEELSQMGFTQDLELAGTIDLVVLGQGTFEEPHLALQLDTDALAVQGEAGGQAIDIQAIDLAADFKLDGKRGSLDPMDLTASLSWQGRQVMGLTAAMEIPLNSWLTKALRGTTLDYFTELQTIPFDVAMTIDRFDLSQVAVAPLFTQSDAAGVISMKLEAAGTARDPEGELVVHIGEMKCLSDPTIDKPCNGFGWDRYRDIVVDGRLALKEKMVSLDHLDVNWDDDDLASAYGSFPLPLDALLDKAPVKDVGYDFTLELKRTELRKLAAVDYAFASFIGSLKGKINLTGTLRKPEAKGCLSLMDTKLGESNTNTGSIALNIDSREATVLGGLKLCKNQGSRVRKLDYDRICTLDEGQAEACITSDTLIYADVAARVNTDLIALSKGADVLTPDATTRVARGELGADDDLFVSIHTREGAPLKLEEVLPMNLISPYARGIEGLLSLDVDAQGTYEAPVPTGELKLSEGALTLTDWGRRFERVEVEARMDPEVIRLEQMRVREGEASLWAEATLEHEKLEPGKVRASFKSDEFNLGDFIDFPFFATSDVTMKGDLSRDPMELEVNVEELDVRLTEDIGSELHPTELNDDIIVLSRKSDGTMRLEGEVQGAAEELGGGGEGGASALALTTRVKMSRQCFVRHPYGEVNLTGDFTAAVKGTSVMMSGEIEALRGQAEFLGKIFRVERALVTFTGADPPNPRLQIEAAYELDPNIVSALGPASDGRPRIMVQITGSANDPILQLKSDPPMSETDIIYVLATNRPPGTAGVGQDSSVAAAALSAASGLLVGMVKDELSDTLPLDFFDVLNVDTSNFEVGKYVYNGKIYLSYRYLFGDIEGNNSIYQFDYHFKPRWTLEAQGSSGETGGELNLNVFWDAF